MTTGTSISSRNGLWPGALLCGALGAVGLLAWWSLPLWVKADVTPFAGHGIFYYLFARNEPIALVLALAFVALLVVLGRDSRLETVDRVLSAPPRKLGWALGLCVFAVGSAGHFTIAHGFPLAMDEYMPLFQAEIFRAGQLRATVPAEWRPLLGPLSPLLATVDVQSGTWMSAYFPMHALLLALCGPLSPLLMPAFGAWAVVLIGGCSAALWGDRRATNAAMLLLASSPQLLINTMTGYPLAANLFFNLLWLRLLLVPSKGAAVLLAPLSAFALLFHQPTPHALFVVPFAVGIAVRRSHSSLLLLWHAAWAGLTAWGALAWLRVVYDKRGDGVTSAASFFGWPDAWDLLNQSMNMGLVLTWLSVPALMLLPLALARFANGQRALERTWLPELAAGAVLCLCVYLAFRSHQGHGWGYRYFFPMMGNVVLLAVAGYRVLRERSMSGAAAPVAATPVVLGALLSLLFLPLRAAQVSSFIGPYAAADRVIAASGASAVAIEGSAAFYGWDLVRNDPFLRRSPKRLRAESVDGKVLEKISNRNELLGTLALQEQFGVPTRREAVSLIARRAVRPRPR